MTQLREQKSILAKLMATEDITVRHAKVPTAGFDPKSRTLILPIMKEMEGEVYDLFVCHEVGHALYTPAEGWHNVTSNRGQHYKGFLNIVEDARIEKKIKKKFHGAAKAMNAGYKVLMHERDFFGLKKFNIDINKAPLIDKLNIHFKGGPLEGVQFSEEEMPYVRKMEELETWEDVELLTELLWEYSEEKLEEMQDFDNMLFNPDVQEDLGDEDEFDLEGEEAAQMEFDQQGEKVDKEDCDAPVDQCDDGDQFEDPTALNEGPDGESDSKYHEDDIDGPKSEQPMGGESGGHDQWYDDNPGQWEPKSITDEEYRTHEEELVDENAYEHVYYNSPKINIDANGLILSYKKLIEITNERIEEQHSFESQHNMKRSRWEFDYVKEFLKECDKENKPVVNYLAKEFEMRKRASEYKRSATANSGVLSLSDIHKYKYSDNIFKKVTIVPEGKNHGLYMLMDWSGSMHEKMMPTFIQLLQLVEFCRKCDIKHDVYAFVDYRYDEDGRKKEELKNRRVEEPIPRSISPIGDNVTLQLIQLFSHKMSKREYRLMREHLMLSLMRCDADYFNAPYMAGRRSRNERLRENGKKVRTIKETKQERVYNLLMKSKHAQGARWDWNAMARNYNLPMSRLCGTPLNSAIMVSVEAVKRFREDNRIDVVNTIILTDGESNSSYYYYDEDKCQRQIATADHNGNRVAPKLVDRETNKVLDWSRSSNMQETKNCLEYYKFKTKSNVVGFFLTHESNVAGKIGAWDSKNGMVRWNSQYTNARDQFSRQGYYIAHHLGYTELYVIKVKNNSTSDEIELKEDSKVTTGSLTRAFKKFQKGKLENRYLLNKFSEMVA